MGLQQFLQIRILKSRPRMERKQKPHLHSCSSVLHLYFSTAWPLEKFLVFSGFFPCCHWAHLNENCSCVSGIILVAALSCGFFGDCEDEDLKDDLQLDLIVLKVFSNLNLSVMHRHYLTVLVMLQRSCLGCQQYGVGSWQNNWGLFGFCLFFFF